MRVLLVANTLPPTDLSGVGEQVVQLAAGLEARGHEVKVLGRSRSWPGSLKLLFPLTIVGPLVRELYRFKPEVVQVHESDGALAALAAKTLEPLLAPQPIVVGLLQVSYWREFLAVRSIRYRGRVLGQPGWRERRFKWLKAPLQIALGWLTVYLVDSVLAPSAVTSDELTRDYLAESVAVVPNASAPRERSAGAEANVGDLPSIDPPEADPAGDVPIVLFVGRLRIRKGLEVAMEALALMADRDEGARLVIVGDGEHRARLEATARRLGLADRIEFMGRKPRAQVDSLMMVARVLVVPSLYEGMPLVIVEAMQSGLPVVASTVSGIPEVVVDGETGWLVPCEDPVALADALREALDDPVEARRRGERGRERLATEFSPAKVAEIWEGLIKPRAELQPRTG